MAEMRIISRSMVKPAEPTWNGTMPLTELDQISVITYASYIYFYNKPASQVDYWLNPSNNKILYTLKDSLSRVLVPFYPLAGRLGWIERGRMKLECNAMGVELMEVESTLKIADFGDFYSCNEKFQNLFVPVDYYGTPIHEIPLLTVQITRFACGGLSVGLSTSHVIVDGKCSFHFIEEWARLARGEPLKVAPFLDRRILQAQAHEEGSITRKQQVFNDENRDYFSNMVKGKPITPTFVVLTKDEIEQLKVVANSNNKEAINKENWNPYSRVEVIGAHVWRCACKARELMSEDITSFTILVDARARMDPPFPSSYFGNVVVDNRISSSVGELISKPLSYACSKIREASTQVTCEYVTKFIEHLKNQESLIKYQYFEDRGKIHGHSVGETNVIAISWLNLAARGLDFGWGKEVYMAPPMIYGCDGDIIIVPYNTNDGSVLVGAFLQPKQKFQEYMSLPL